MRRPTALAASVLAAPLVAAAAPSPVPDGFTAAAAVVDITPETGGRTFGYVRPDITVDGVALRLTARALVLADGEREVALVSTDLGVPFDKESLVARVADLGLTAEDVLYTASHTHAGPGELEGWQLDRIADAIRDAHARRVPARAAWATRDVHGVSRNRSIEAHLANHGVELFYGQGSPHDDPDGPGHTLDPQLRLLRVDTADGRPLAAWTDLSVHPTSYTPDNTTWSADFPGVAVRVFEDGFPSDRRPVALFSNGNQGDLMPVFDAWNQHAVADQNGRRIAAAMRAAWREAGPRLRGDVPVDVRWTRRCYCGQEVEPGRAVAAVPMWGAAFFGGSEEGASIFHEPLATEGRRRSERLADPVHGTKILVAPAPWERTPEFQVVRVGEALLLAAPGEPSVEAGRRFERAVAADLPRGVTDVFTVGLANDYIGYLTTAAEHDMQHYEGGHTVFGRWTALLAERAFVDLVAAMAAGEPPPPTDAPAGEGDTGSSDPAVGGGAGTGALVDGPPQRVERMAVVTVAWDGGPRGHDRPLDEAFLVLERRTARGWRTVETDLGTGFVWHVRDRRYEARYDVPPGLAPGTYRIGVRAARYGLATRPFEVVPASGLRVRGVTVEPSGGSNRLVFAAQNPPPDPARSVRIRPRSPTGGTVTFVADGRELVARWDVARGGWVATVPVVPDRVVVPAGGLVDGLGNRSGGATVITVGEVAPLDWPPHMGPGGGRTPGPFGEGEFPP